MKQNFKLYFDGLTKKASLPIPSAVLQSNELLYARALSLEEAVKQEEKGSIFQEFVPFDSEEIKECCDLYKSLQKKAIGAFSLQKMIKYSQIADKERIVVLFRYLDESNDVVTIASHQELLDAILEEELKPIKLEVYLESEELSVLDEQSDHEESKIQQLLGNSDVFQSAQSNLIIQPAIQMPLQQPQQISLPKKEEPAPETTQCYLPIEKQEPVAKKEPQIKTRRKSTDQYLIESIIENEKLESQEQNYIETLCGGHSDKVSALRELKFFLSPLYLQKILMELMSDSQNQQKVYHMVKDFGLLDKDQPEDLYDIRDFGTRLKEIENYLLHLDAPVIQELKQQKEEGSAFEEESKSILDLDQIKDAVGRIQFQEELMRLTEHDKNLLKLSEDDLNKDDGSSPNPNLMLKSGGFKLSEVDMEILKKSEFFLTGSEDVKKQESTVPSTTKKSNILEQIPEQLSYYPGSREASIPSLKQVEAEFLKVQPAHPTYGLQTLKAHLSTHQTDAMALLSSLSEKDFSDLLTNALMLKIDKQDKDSSLQKRAKQLEEKQGPLVVLPLSQVLKLMESRRQACPDL